MLPFSKDKIISYYAEALKIKKGKFPMPRMALLYPSYACGHHCDGCHYKDWNKEHDASPFMDYEKFRGLIKELKGEGVKSIEFCGGGEPTVHPEFRYMITDIADKGFQFGLFTNAEGIKDDNASLLVTNASYVRVSLDQETEWDNIERLIKAKKANNSKCLIGAKILINDINAKHLHEKVAQALYYEMDYVQIKSEKPTKYPIKIPNIITSVIDDFKRDHKNVFGGIEHTTLEGKCWLSPIHTMIDVYGDVYICCYFQFRKHGHRIGNVFEDSFSSIWLSKKHQDHINEIVHEDCNVFDCRWHTYNKHMTKFIEDGHINFI